MNPNLEMLKSLEHFFQALDGLIDAYGIYLYLVFVWLALPIIAWILSGGLRRWMKGSATTIVPVVIFMAQPPRRPGPSIVDIAVEQTWNDDAEIMDEL